MRRSSHGSRLPSRDERMGIKIGIVSLGCAKNLADSEVILGCLREGGFEVAEHLDEAQVVIVNTCAFIAEAARESIETILEAAREPGRKVVVTGCLVERYGEELAGLLPEVDAFVGRSRYGEIDRSSCPRISRTPRRSSAPPSLRGRRPRARWAKRDSSPAAEARASGSRRRTTRTSRSVRGATTGAATASSRVSGARRVRVRRIRSSGRRAGSPRRGSGRST